MGLFDDIKPISDLPDGKPFLLLNYRVQNKDTVYGVKDQFVLTVAWDEDGLVELFSGYSAGVLAQLGNANRSDFPVWVKLETTSGTAGKSGTRKLVPSDKGDAIPVQAALDDDIPF